MFLLLTNSCKKEDNKQDTTPVGTVPVLTTSTPSSITQTAATSGGNISSDGDRTVIARGVCWSTGQTPNIGDSKTSDGTGAGNFTSAITGLLSNTTYYVRAYATNTAGTGYGNVMSFTTQQVSTGTLTGPGALWTAVTTPTGSSSWRGVAYGNNIWVAVGGGRRATSVDGKTWTSVAVMGDDFVFQNDVVFANGIFIIASSNGVSISTNGTVWTRKSLTGSQFLIGLAYGNGTWVMANRDRFINSDVLAFMVSTTNGSGWSQALTTIPYAQPTSVAFGNGQFVTVGWGGMVAKSTNGTTWVQQNLGSTSDLGLLAVTYADGKFVAVTNSGKAYRSTNGSIWTKSTVTENALNGVSYGNGLFVAVGMAGSIFTSPDAVTWTKRTWSGPNVSFNNVGFGNNQFVLIGNNSFAVSQDGTSSPGGDNYYYANWTCGTSSQCAVVMGAPKGSNGPFCTKAACEAWKVINIPGSCNCETAPNTLPVNGAPPNGKCFP